MKTGMTTDWCSVHIKPDAALSTYQSPTPFFPSLVNKILEAMVHTPFWLRTVISDIEVLILILAASHPTADHLSVNGSSLFCRNVFKAG